VVASSGLWEVGRKMNDQRLEDVLGAKLTRRRLLESTGLTAVAAALLAACGGGGDDGGGGDGGSGGGGDADVDITVRMIGSSSQDFAFDPKTIEVMAGVETTLLFVNESAQPHSFRIDGIVDTTVIKNPGSEAKSTESTKKVTFTIPEPGDKMFYCSAHGPQSESGTVIVT
jgi:plastocyanin